MSKKEMVIDTARELFVKYGYRKVSMDEIASSSGVTKKTIYTYFKDKEDLFSYFVKEELDKMKNVIDDNIKNNSSFIEVVANNVYQMLLFKKNSLLISTINDEIKLSNDSKGLNFLKMYDDEIKSYIENKIKLGIANKHIKECDVHLVAFVIYKVYVAIMFEYDQEIDEELVTKRIISFLKDGVLVKGEI